MSIDNGSLTDNPPPRPTAGIIAVAVVALAVFLMALRPLRSPDVWHHLKSGWFVVQNRGPHRWTSSVARRADSRGSSTSGSHS